MQFVVMVNNKCKFKVLETETFETIMTIAGPCYDSPISNFMYQENNDTNINYFAFQTTRSLGIQMFSLDGNPMRRIALYACANKIINFCISYDKKFGFIVGDNEKSISMWKTNLKSMDATSETTKLTELEWYCTQLPGGKNGWLFREIQDMFYYMQIIGKGVENQETRAVGDTINVADIPDFMRGLGFFPSEYEVNISDLEPMHFVEKLIT